LTSLSPSSRANTAASRAEQRTSSRHRLAWRPRRCSNSSGTRHPRKLPSGSRRTPKDYLESFAGYLKANLNKVPALLIATQRPRELTRHQLKELRLLLDTAGYNEVALQTAWRETTNQDIAASIIGFIRRASLGDALVPYAERVDRALKTILASRPWTDPQRKWLDRIGKQLRAEFIVDRDALERGQFKTQGGFNRINKVFDGKLEAVLGDLHQALWESVA
jgi:type I restriction enzyme R subunit